MTRQDFEDILTGPQDLTLENLQNVLEYSRREKTSVEYKVEFEREQNGKVNLLDFCKLMLGFLNADVSGCVVIYGITREIDSSTSEPVSSFVQGHMISGARREDLVGYIRLRIWPRHAHLIHIKQLPINDEKAVTSIYVGKGTSKPYLYYDPDNPSVGVRSFIRGSGVTSEMRAPELHEFIQSLGTKEAETGERATTTRAARKEPDWKTILRENLEQMSSVLKEPKEFGLCTIAVFAETQISVSDDEIKNILQPTRGGNVRPMEELWYCEPLKTTQKWYRRIFVPRGLEKEMKAVWALTCYRGTGTLIVNNLIDEFLKGEKCLNDWHLSYQIQRLLQMARVLYADKTQKVKIVLDFAHIDRFVYPKYWGHLTEKTYPYAGEHEPIVREVNLDDILLGAQVDILAPAVVEAIKEVAKIFGLDDLPNDLVDKNNEMLYVQTFKGQR